MNETSLTYADTTSSVLLTTPFNIVLSKRTQEKKRLHQEGYPCLRE